MTLLGKHAIICLEAIRDDKQRANLIGSLTNGAHPVDIIELTLKQIENMSANAQNVTNNKGEDCVIISRRGFSALTEGQKQILNSNYAMVISNVDMIESVGGGSCRCMLVENWSSTEVPVK